MAHSQRNSFCASPSEPVGKHHHASSAVFFDNVCSDAPFQEARQETKHTSKDVGSDDALAYLETMHTWSAMIQETMQCSLASLTSLTSMHTESNSLFDAFYNAPPSHGTMHGPNHDVAFPRLSFATENRDMDNAQCSSSSSKGYGTEIPSALSIFSKEIMHEVLAKAQKAFLNKLQRDPNAFADMAWQHVERLGDAYLKGAHAALNYIDHPSAVSSIKDHRFAHPLWQHPYFKTLHEHYMAFSHFTHTWMQHIEDELEDHVRNKMHFYIKQVLALLSPSNFPTTNPEVIARTIETQGANLKEGYAKLLNDIKQGALTTTHKTAFAVGKTIANTPGYVVYENTYLQLIRYTPVQSHTYSAPLLIIPAWINKFYLFDLSGDNSFVKWCLHQGIDVYMISWANPSAAFSNASFSDYALEGLWKAVRYIQKKTKAPINALGNCAGGILLNCLMAYLSKKGISSPFKSATTLASPIDASKLNDLKAFICDAQIRMLEQNIQAYPVISGKVLEHSFNLLRPSELIWRSVVDFYWMNETPKAFDMLFWNQDTVNLPARMHSEYLRKFFLENHFMTPKLTLNDTKISLGDILTPSFVVGAEKDHIAPWQSVYPLAQKVQSVVREFILTGSGHVFGIINPPYKNKYHYWTGSDVVKNAHMWKETANCHEGSWWPYWKKWLTPYLGEKREARAFTNAIESAPGRYVTTN